MNLESMVGELLTENRRRGEAARFDPMTGEGAPGSRVAVEMKCPVLGVGKRWLPESMLKTDLGRSVIENGGVEAFARERGLSTEQVGELFELVRLRHDFAYWGAKYGLIRPKRGGENAPLILNRAQRKLVGRFEEMRTAGKPIRVILLKARQWGGSTVIQLYMVWLQLTRKLGLNSLIVAHQNAATEEIRSMMKRVVDSYPSSLLNVDFEAAEKGLLTTGDNSPTPTKIRRRKKDDDSDGDDGAGKSPLKAIGRSGNAWHLPQRNCDFKLGTAERPDSARGGSYSLIHLSEVGIWKSTEGKKPGEIVVSTTSGVLFEPDTFIALESTAKGKGTYFHKEYVAACEGKSQWSPVFVPWFEIEQYSLAVEDPERFARDLFTNRENDDHDERSASGRYLWGLWESGASLEAINWYVKERLKYDSASSMASEYPSDDLEAFASSGSPVFDLDTIARLKEGITDGHTDHRGTFHSTVWNPFNPGREYFAVLKAGAVETESRSALLVVDITDPKRPAIAAQVTGQCRRQDELVEMTVRMCRNYGSCRLAIANNREKILESGHTAFIAWRLKEEWPALHPPSRSELTYELSGRTKIFMTDTLAKLIAEGIWSEPSAEAIEQFESLEADDSVGYRPVCGAEDDLVTVRALAAYISTVELA